MSAELDISAVSAAGAAESPAPAGPAAGLAVTTHGLTKRFRGGQLAVDGLDMAVPRGSVYGFLGPNGSGKTTTIRMLLGLVFSTSGSHELLGTAMPSGAARVLPRVGSLVEGPAFYPQLSGRANLARIDAADATADPRTAGARVGAALERVGLTAAAKKHYRAYSLGMKQRLAIAASLLQPRELIILDEPTNGLDPQGTREVRGLIREIATGGVTVLVSSHLLAEVEQICTPRRRDADRQAGVPGHAGGDARPRRRPGAGAHHRTRPCARACSPSSGWPTSRPATARSAPRSAGKRRSRYAVSWSSPGCRWLASTRHGPAWRTCSWSSPGRASMSTAEVAPVPPRRYPAWRRRRTVRPWLRLLRSELALVFRRWRNRALLAVVAAIPILLGVALRVAVPRGGGGGGAGLARRSSPRSRATGCSWRSCRSPSC